LTGLNKVKVELALSTPRSHIGGVEVWLHLFSTYVQDEGKWSTSCSGHFILGKMNLVPIE